jgi:hypothetical protein
VFAGKLHDANISGMITMMFEDVFVENKILGKFIFER